MGRGVVLAVDLAIDAEGVSASSPARTYLAGLSQPVGLVAAGGVLYVGDWGSGTLYRIDGR